MKKITKGMLVAFVSMIICVGAVYATYQVLNRESKTTVKEPISFTWEQQLPDDTYPNQTYDFRFCIHNVAAATNGTQLVGVEVSTNLQEGALSDGNWNTKNTFSLNMDSEKCIDGTVKVASDSGTGEGEVEVNVTRE
jgi:archaellum component FlaF (FlaF/FlaG flagellin family)